MQVAEPTRRYSDSVGEAWELVIQQNLLGIMLQKFGTSAHKAYGLPSPGCHWAGCRGLGSSPQWLVTL